MADIRCPNCGKSNPDLLEVCQYCQTPLKPDSVLHIGEKPTKKNTGELEPILPDWLKDVRQQARSAAEEEAAQASSFSKAKKDEPPDLLAGLASQASSEEEDVPDWLASLNPTAKSKPSVPSEPADASSTDFFARFNQKESKPEPVRETPPQEESPSWMSGMRDQAQPPAEKDELSEWFAQASEKPEEIAEKDHSDAGWGSSLDFPSSSTPTPPAKEQEDLSWLHDLEAAAKQTGELQTPKQGTDWKPDFEMPSTPAGASQQDLSWLDRLGGIEEPLQPTAQQPAAPQEDLNWLDQFGGISEPAQPPTPAASQQDLSWLKNFGAPSEPQPMDAAPNQPIESGPFVSGEDLDWLNKLGGGSEPVQPAQSLTPLEDKKPAEDLSWLNELGGKPEELAAPPFTDELSRTEKVTPRQTAPLNKQAPKEPEPEPDWLKRATEAPSMPAPGDLSMDWFSGSGQTTREKTPPSTPPTAPFESDIFSTPSEPASLSNEDVDSLFSVEMPDWLSHSEPETATPVSEPTGAVPTESDESLAPVDLPSWVQAMRPVEAVISETASAVADQPAETEGPLAGLHGVIPIAPMGSARRPKPVSLTLQAPPEQQASAVLLEQILGSETSPRALAASAVVESQQWLRWALSALFLLVLSAVLLLRSQIMPVAVPAALPDELSGLSNTVIAIPVNSKILVVIDYEPSLAGEMEAISGPLLDQITLLSQPDLSFVSTSPNGAALVERLVAKTGINQSVVQHHNLGYLPGGAAGVRGFMAAPSQIIPSAGVQFFSEYAALIVLTDHAESGRVWVEQLQTQSDPGFRNQRLLMVASAQAGPLLQPYVSSRQITGMISGLSDAAQYESLNNNRPGIARSYWDTFGIGLMMAIALIIIGSLWSLFTGMRARRVSAEQG